MLAVPKRGDCLLGMSRVRAGDRNGIDIRIATKGSDVIGGTLNSEFVGEISCFLDASTADGDDFRLRVGKNAGDVANLREASGADHGNPEFFNVVHCWN